MEHAIQSSRQRNREFFTLMWCPCVSNFFWCKQFELGWTWVVLLFLSSYNNTNLRRTGVAASHLPVDAFQPGFYPKMHRAHCCTPAAIYYEETATATQYPIQPELHSGINPLGGSLVLAMVDHRCKGAGTKGKNNVYSTDGRHKM